MRAAARFGLKVGDVSRGKLPARIQDLASGDIMLKKVIDAVAQHWGSA